MSLVVCTGPRCQTTAGCVCGAQQVSYTLTEDELMRINIERQALNIQELRQRLEECLPQIESNYVLAKRVRLSLERCKP